MFAYADASGFSVFFVVFVAMKQPWRGDNVVIWVYITLGLSPGSRNHLQKGIYGSLISQKFLLLVR